MLGNIILRRLPVPGVVAFAVGTAAESLLIFLLLLVGAARPVAFAVLAAACVTVYWRGGRRAPRLHDPVKQPAGRFTLVLAGTALAAYVVLYFINALAPELQPDAAGYHLGLVAEYLRRGRFPARVGVYEIIPQGLEMLFLPAFAIGRHSAAKLVHLAFTLATVPLMLRIGRRLAVPDGASWGAAILYFCAPVVGVSGTSAYNDATLVFFVLCTFYLLLVWRDTHDMRYLMPAGLTAGFCYAIKMPGLIVPILAVIFVAVERRSIPLRVLGPLAAASAAVILPWMLRALVMTGNPAAPLANWLFPNPYFHPNTLTGTLTPATDIPLWRYPFELAVGGSLVGIVGPAFLALPLGFIALRRRAGRLCWRTSVLLALPWVWNQGTRFLMPALPFLALAIMMALPNVLVWACLAVQSVGCWPQLAALYDSAHTWRLRGFPLAAALRIEPENDYLAARLGDYRIARIIQSGTRPRERVYSLISVAMSYTDREVLQFWHSAQAESFIDSLRVVSFDRDTPFYEVRAVWSPRLVWGVAVRAAQSSPAEWCIHDLMLYSGGYRIFGSPQWRLRAWPNVWELPLVFDENRATRWRSWRPIRAGMYVEAAFDRPQVLSGAVMTSHTPGFHVPFEFYLRGPHGWRLITARPDIKQTPLGDLRMAATRAIRAAGYQYLLVSSDNEGNGPIGKAIAGHEVEWGLEKAGVEGRVTLYRIK